MPLNAAHRFIQSNALVFRSRLPKRAAIRFEGTIEFPADDADGISNERDLSVHALIPYGLATTVPARFESRRLDGFDLHGEQMGISLFLQRRNPTPFVDDRQDGSLALRVSVLPPAEPAIGPTGWMPREQWESERPVLGECPILGVKATLRATRSTTAAVQSMRDILPTGTYEYITRTDRVNKDGKSLNLLDMPTDPLPAFTCILENHDESETNLVIRTTCDDLGISESHNVVVPPRSRRVVEVTPVMPETPPIFQRFIDGPDEDLGIATVEVQTQIYPKDQNERAGLSPHSERRTVLNALPPDYIVWAVTNHKDGSVIGLHHHIARWVTPDEPVLDPLLKEWGCPTGDRTEDLRRIYDGLLPMNFAYDLDRVNTGAEMDHDYQRVRLPRVSLRHRRINCIDGTVLIASLLERLGHSPIILLLPGHAFLGLVTRGKTDAVKSMHFIETTGLCRRWQIGSNSVSIATDPRAGTTLTSTHAATVGLAQFKKAEFDFMGERTTKLNRKESDPKAISPSKPRAPGHHIVTLEAARKRGIMPFAPQA